jgi:hypothetical protein
LLKNQFSPFGKKGKKSATFQHANMINEGEYRETVFRVLEILSRKEFMPPERILNNK